MKRIDTSLGVLRIPIDILAVLAALLLSYRFREANVDLIPNVQLLESATTLPSFGIYVETFVLPATAVFVLLAAIARLYVLQVHFSTLREFQRIVVVALCWLVGIMAWFFLVQRQLFYSRILLVHSTVFITIFVAAGRLAIRILKHALLRHGIGAIRVVSVGSVPLTEAGAAMLTVGNRYTYGGHVSSVVDLRAIKQEHPDLVLQTDPSPASEATLALIDYCRSEHIEYAFLPPVFADVPHRLRIQRIGTTLLIRFQPTPLDGWGRVLKRSFDVVVSALLLVLLSPLLLAVSIGVLITSGWPIFYVSKRVGERGAKKIPVLKFRSMVQEADVLKESLTHLNERTDGPLFKMKNDPRITGFGRFLRRFDIDELPQLLNVFVGHMSLVGPRPHLPEEVARYKAYERRVFAVRPGITGLAQVSGRSDLPFEQEVQLDLQYIEEWSLRRDLRILLFTVLVVLQKKDA